MLDWPADWIELHVPRGAESAPVSFGAQSYHCFLADHRDPNSGWRCVCPPHVAASLCSNAGFCAGQNGMNSTLTSDHGDRVSTFPARSTSLGAGGIACQDPWRWLHLRHGQRRGDGHSLVAECAPASPLFIDVQRGNESWS
jgi:hypothetical protein